uniref:Histone-lysine N-methyltransferase ASHH2 n=1 Tax=Ananas comosus var. bracteatus TaxID=296719 RepID=A0A6V7Q1S0_ANACO|nr:unnamed protein product [Ananas comosus var. bracteatus]
MSEEEEEEEKERGKSLSSPPNPPRRGEAEAEAAIASPFVSAAPSSSPGTYPSFSSKFLAEASCRGDPSEGEASMRASPDTAAQEFAAAAGDGCGYGGGSASRREEVLDGRDDEGNIACSAFEPVRVSIGSNVGGSEEERGCPPCCDEIKSFVKIIKGPSEEEEGCKEPVAEEEEKSSLGSELGHADEVLRIDNVGVTDDCDNTINGDLKIAKVEESEHFQLAPVDDGQTVVDDKTVNGGLEVAKKEESEHFPRVPLSITLEGDGLAHSSSGAVVGLEGNYIVKSFDENSNGCDMHAGFYSEETNRQANEFVADVPTNISPSVGDDVSLQERGEQLDRVDASAINVKTTCTDNLTDPFGHVNAGESMGPRRLPLIVFRRTNPKRAASLWNTSSNENSNQLSGKRKITRKNRKEVGIAVPLLSNIIKIPNQVTRKRSYSRRQSPQSSAWGKIENLSKIFIQNQELLMHLPDSVQLQGRRSKKSISGHSLKRCQTSWRNKNFRSSKTKSAALTNSIDAKEQMNLESAFPVSVDLHASLQPNTCDNMPNLNQNATLLVSDEIGKATNVEVKLLQRDGLQLERDLESSLTQETCSDYILGESNGVSSHTGSGLTLGSVRGMLDPGSSPDSDLYNPVMDIGSTPAIQDVVTLQSSVVPDLTVEDGFCATNKAVSSPASASSFDLEQKTTDTRGKNSKKSHGFRAPVTEEKLQGSQKLKKAKNPKSLCRHKCKKKDRSKVSNLNSTEFLSGKCSEEGIDEKSSLTDRIEENKSCRSTKSKVGKGKSSKLESSRRRRQNCDGKRKVNVRKEVNGAKSNELNSEPNHRRGPVLKDQLTYSVVNIGDKVPLGETASILEGQSLRPRVAWVLCDDCQKWRCIPAALADIIDATNCGWTCKDNADKAFADCSIPQEKTNAEINAELDLSDASCDEDSSKLQPISKGNKPLKSAASQPASWTHIKSNLFLHRSRKTQTIDETMVCHCKPPEDGRMGCGEECLNRMLNIECVKGTCPCGDLCSNQQFQKRNYTKFKWFRCGKKGFGLQLLEDVSQGQFLIEYVGEVLDIPTYEARQRYYASRGQKHFYFMTLNGGEVIDACAKGNLGRFINHSCEPNCRTEKWMVNGEVCIGLFAIHDIKKGEEVTFDYNYVRVFGAAAKKCVCGSAECRGYIGGDPSNSEVIVQGDSDEEYLEPVMINETGEKELNVLDAAFDAGSDINVVKQEEISIQQECMLNKSGEISDNCQQSREIVCIDNIDTEKAIRTPVYNIEAVELSLETSDPLNEAAPATPPYRSGLIIAHSSDDKQIESKSDPVPKSSTPSGPTKKSKSSVKTKISRGAKKLLSSSGGGHFDGVEGKLNELLDADGGISKRIDSTKGYLKLLFVTAAEGDSDGRASQSTRDLSLILDALLKTKSRSVLVDIINKNGLQMLHNIMKQNRNNFNRIPIIRKLLKVLEFFAQKGILTPEHITRGPPCSGMESFKDSILSLTRHNDTQVHQIARSFRDKWIPRSIRRVEPSDRDHAHLDSPHSYSNWFQSPLYKCRYDQSVRDSDAIICVSGAAYQPTPTCAKEVLGGNPSNPNQQVSNCGPTDSYPTRVRKRKSRWDQDSPNVSSYEDQCSKLRKISSGVEVINDKTQAEREEKSCFEEAASLKGSIPENMEEEVPPGFGSPRKGASSGSASALGEVSMGHPQERYLPQLSISYGIPLTLIQQFGTIDAEAVCWKVAPGMPFHPFPPLPSYPRGELTTITSSQTSNYDNVTQSANQNYTGERLDRGERERGRWSSNRPGRTFFRSWRGNNQKFHRCWSTWPREGNDGGFRGRY